MLTEVEYRKRLKDKNSRVELLGHYLGMHKKHYLGVNNAGMNGMLRHIIW